MENRLENALQVLRDDSDHRSLNAVAASFDVAATTLRRRRDGIVGHDAAHQSQQKLYPEEENALVRHLELLAAQGWAKDLTMVQYIAEDVLRRRTRSPAATLGHHWVERFLKRHPRFAKTWSTKIDSVRADSARSGVVEDFLQCLQAMREERGIQPQDIYNMDEKGFVMGKEGRRKLVVRGTHRKQDAERKRVGNRDFMTIVEIVPILEDLLSPLII